MLLKLRLCYHAKVSAGPADGPPALALCRFRINHNTSWPFDLWICIHIIALQFLDFVKFNRKQAEFIQGVIMATMTFESSLSTSAMRPPLSSADAPSMADSLPSVNFGFDELRERMNRFTVRFDEFIDKGRKRVLEDRNQFRMNIAELMGPPSLCQQPLMWSRLTYCYV